MTGFRDRFLRALVLFGGALVFITESLSALHSIRRGPLAICWIAVVAAAVIGGRRQRITPTVSRDPIVWISSAGIAAILALTAVTAAFSPPNSADAMAYHMPRVVYWAEEASVRFFPTPYLNQIMLQPLAEYMMLHTYVLSNGDRLINFVQWFGSLASIIGVSAIACEFGAGPRGQAMAALFCATIPAGVLASSGAKNDYWLAMWLVAAVYFALQYTKSLRLTDALFLGAAVGLALFTKATAYLFAPWPLAAIFITHAQKERKRLVAGAVIAAALGIALNTPQYLRNRNLSGSIMGFDSAQGDGFFRWRNDDFGWKETVSNALRHLSEQLGARSDAWNRGIYNVVIEAHKHLGIDINDPRTTWRWSSYTPPKNANHEADVPNRWQLVIPLALFAVMVVRSSRYREIGRLLYALSLLCGFILMCAYLKWQPFMGRLLLPLFVLASPLMVEIGEKRWLVQLVLCWFLLSNARRPAIENWVRPLKGPNSVLHTSRDTQYFADMTPWNNQASYWQTLDLLARSSCETVGIDSTDFQLEYPLEALLRERKPSERFIHAGVLNASAKYPQPIAESPCAIVCLECAGDAKRLELYRDFTNRADIGKFAVLTP